MNNTDIFENATSLVGFAPGVDSTSSMVRQSANLLSLTSESGGGMNPFAIEQGSLGLLVSCLTKNDCLVEPLASNFISCTVFKLIGTPPCKNEFDAAIEGLDLGEIAQCFLQDGEMASENMTQIVPDGFSLDAFEASAEGSQNDTLMCLLRTILPPGTQNAVNSILEAIESLSGIVMFVVDIIQNGLQIPGELILYFFGWAVFTEDFEFVAPWKWWWCMGSVAIFLAAIETFKIFAVEKIVWTKR